MLRFHTVVFPLCSVPGTAISSGNELLRLITLISAGQALWEIRLRAYAYCQAELIAMRFKDANNAGKNRAAKASQINQRGVMIWKA